MNEEFLCNFARRTGVHKVFRPFYGGLGSILMFHRIRERGKSPRIEKNRRGEVSPEFLESLVRLFRAEGWAIVSLDEVYAILARGRGRGRFVCFTFDDGYSDAWTLAYPLFRTLGAPFAVYVCTDFPDGRAIMWHYLLEDLIVGSERVRFEWGQRAFDFATGTEAQKEAAFHAMRNLILGAGSSAVPDLLRCIFEPRGVDLLQYSQGLALSWDQIRAMSADPLVTIGAHTVSHRALNRLGAEEAWFEISESRRVLESRIGRSVAHFSYPFGSRGETGEREVKMASEAGFLTATTTRVANVFPGHVRHLTCLPRIPVRGTGEDFSYLQAFLSGFVPALTHKLRRVVTL